MDGWMDGWADGPMDGWTDGPRNPQNLGNKFDEIQIRAE